MGFMDKAKQMAQQVQQEAKDGTLKDRAKQVAEQAQAKLDEVQDQFNSSGGQAASPSAAAATEYDQHGRPVASDEPQPAVPSPAPTPEPQPEDEPAVPPPAPPAETPAPPAPAAGADPAAGVPPKLSSGDPLAG
jgi:hypothetical protein